jgi:hypothetical protein
MSVPLIMTVYSRPLSANTYGSIGTLQYGGYNDLSRPEEFLDEEYFENPYRQDLDLSDQEEGFNFNHSRNARSRFKRSEF